MGFPRARILIVEDEFIIAEALVDRLTELGYECLGPVADLHSAIALVQAETFDAAILDVRLREERVDVVADMLAERGIPFAFATGDSSAVADKWLDRPCIRKPYSDAAIRFLVEGLIPASASDPMKAAILIDHRGSRAMGYPLTPPQFAIRQSDRDGSWIVVVTWPEGQPDYIGGFSGASQAERWVEAEIGFLGARSSRPFRNDVVTRR